MTTLVRAASRARTDARPSGPARHGAEPRCVLPGARGQQSLLSRLSGHRAGRHGSLRAPDRTRSIDLFDYVGAPDAERVIVLMGSGAGRRRRDVERLHAARRKSRPAEGAPVPAIRRGRVSCRSSADNDAARSRVLDRTKEPGSIGEPLYQDVVTALMRSAMRRAPSPALAARHRRTLWAVVEGIHPGDGQGGLR